MRGFAAVMAGLGLALALGGCASVTAAAPPQTSTTKPSPAPPMSNQAVAIVDEHTVMAAFRPPSGAKQVTGPPPGAGALVQANTTIALKYTAHGTQWWTVPDGRPKAVLTGLARPHGATDGGSSFGGGQYEQDFDWPPTRSVIYDKYLSVSAMVVGGHTVLRVDADVIWFPTRASSSLVPSTATEVTVTYTPGMFVTGKPRKYGPLAVTDPATVNAVAKAVNVDPVNPLGGLALPCPYGGGASMSLKFHAGVNGRTVATTYIEPGGCGDVTVSVIGGSKADLFNGHALVSKIASLLGVAWPMAK